MIITGKLNSDLKVYRPQTKKEVFKKDFAALLNPKWQANLKGNYVNILIFRDEDFVGNLFLKAQNIKATKFESLIVSLIIERRVSKFSGTRARLISLITCQILLGFRTRI